MGYIFATKARIDNRKKLVKQQYVPTIGPLAAEIGLPVWGTPCKFQRLSRLGSVTARQSTSERQPNFAALNRGRHLCSAGRPSRWALAHISSLLLFSPHLPPHGRWEAESTKAVQYGHASRFEGGGGLVLPSPSWDLRP